MSKPMNNYNYNYVIVTVDNNNQYKVINLEDLLQDEITPYLYDGGYTPIGAPFYRTKTNGQHRVPPHTYLNNKVVFDGHETLSQALYRP
jgi:starvation-inducible outer membrane lipoprotein